MDLSVVTTLYRSAPHIEEFYRRITAAARQITVDYELIFVDDGSPDDSLTVALELCVQDRHVRVIELSRNFGHHRAIMTGLEHATGELVFLLDSDLEEAPELLQQFYSQIHAAADLDVVYGVQQKRKGDWFERLSGNLFYWIFNLLSTYPIPANQLTARLMKRRYVKALVQHRDREICLVGLMAVTGFRQSPCLVAKGNKGATTYSLLKRASLFVNAVTSFSNRPLIFIFYVGTAVVVVSAVCGIALIVRELFVGPYLAGWASLMVSLWFLGGLMIFCVGIVGVYLSRVYMETKERPYTIVRHFHQNGSGDPQAGNWIREAEIPVSKR